MLLGGLQKLTLIDYPGKVAATVFTAGCNFFCPFCHNPDLVLLNKSEQYPFLSEEQFFWWMEKNLWLLDGVCISGGEPTIHKDLPDFIKEIKSLGFAVKLDTNGSNPEMLEYLIKNNLIDYAAMDIKAPINKYSKFYRLPIDTAAIKKSVELIRQMADYELRTTVIPDFHKKRDFTEIGQWLTGSKKYVLQQFRPEKTLDPAFTNVKPYSDEELECFCEGLKPCFKKCEVRL
ncbi:MAG: anaerobic ribonucleoside-triphosphate reductase activating protein [Candidatus Portnoybacteria bacterium]|nr:anaerobic ribonucleoside-triphosphate reductase activating protein [Candidatus Portnoybacteria bacterium]